MNTHTNSSAVVNLSGRKDCLVHVSAVEGDEGDDDLGESLLSWADRCCGDDDDESAGED